MTLIRPEGIWQSADQRVKRGGTVVDDEAAKHMTIHCPPAGSGPKMLLGFTGLAEAPDGTPTLQWVRETLRGESRFIDPMLHHLRDRLDRDFGRSRLWHHVLILTGGVMEADGKRFYVELTNVDPKTWEPRREFRLSVMQVTEPMFFAGGSGAYWISQPDFALVKRQMNLRPRRWEDHLGLLAAVNRRTAKRDKEGSVSRWCQATYFGVDAEGAAGRAFRESDDPPETRTVPTLLFGIDMTDTTDAMFTRLRDRTLRSDDELGRPPDPAVEGRA